MRDDQRSAAASVATMYWFRINPTLRVLCKVGYGLRVPVSEVLVMAERLAAERRRAQISGEQA